MMTADPVSPLVNMSQFSRYMVETVKMLVTGRADAMEKEDALKRLLARQ